MLERWKIKDQMLCSALTDLLHFYDRVAGTGQGEGWSTADVLRLEQIRKLCL
jgi:hypothetical protein